MAVHGDWDQRSLWDHQQAAYREFVSARKKEMEGGSGVQKGLINSLTCTNVSAAGPAYVVGCPGGDGSWSQEDQLACSSSQVEMN